MKRILVDTGPRVAILSRDDSLHETCVKALREMASHLLSCWPVVTETAWLLRHSPRAVQQLLSNTDGGFLELLPLAGSEAKALSALMKRYEASAPSFPMPL
jgi:predicted nucleic acid-binding protein